MRDHHPFYRKTVQRRVENRAPMQAAFFGRDACVHNHPSIAIAQEPEVNPLEGKWQRHTDPVDAIRDLFHGPNFWRFATWIGQAIG